MLPPGYTLRSATLDDLGNLEALIALSARELGAGYYTPDQIDGALRGAFGVDTQLLRDGTYFVVESESQMIACGGWSRRRTLFGGDARSDRDSAELNPRTDAAKIRAFFVHPAFARRGIGAAILEHCEMAAMGYGFLRFELMATLPGAKLYASKGYVAGTPIQWPLGNNLNIEFVPMTKRASNNRSERVREP